MNLVFTSRANLTDEFLVHDCSHCDCPSAAAVEREGGKRGASACTRQNDHTTKIIQYEILSFKETRRTIIGKLHGMYTGQL